MTDDPLPAFAKADGVLDFTMPAATVEFAGYAAQARIVHVIGTTGCSAGRRRQDRGGGAPRHDRQVGQYEPRRQSARRAGRAGGAGRSTRATSTSRSSKCTTATRSTRRPARRCCSARRRPPGATIALAENSVRVRDGHTGVRPGGAIGFATLRGGSVVGEHSASFLAGTGERITLSHHAEDRGIFARGAVKAALWAPRQEARPLFDARRARASRGERMRRSGAAALVLWLSFAGSTAFAADYPFSGFFTFTPPARTQEKAQLYCGYSFFIQGKDGTYVDYHLDLPRFLADGTVSFLEYGRGICTVDCRQQVEICTATSDTDPDDAGQDVSSTSSGRPSPGVIELVYFDGIAAAQAFAAEGTGSREPESRYSLCAGFDAAGMARYLSDRPQHAVAGRSHEDDLPELDDATMAIMTRVLETIRADKKE